ncbi:MAG: GHMP kinase [Anaerolineales bacterium]
MGFRPQPKIVINSCAPVRICDIGGWTDTWFSKKGGVFHIAVSPYVEVQLLVFGDSANEDLIFINAENYKERYRYKLQGQTAVRKWHRHPLLEAAFEIMNLPPGIQLEATIYSSAPASSSIGTSASVIVALLSALDMLTPDRMGLKEIAQTAHRVETELLQGQSGIQDQLCAACGGINFIDMYEYPHANVHQLKIPEELSWELEKRLHLICVGKSHRSSDLHEKVIKTLEHEGPGSRKLEDLRAAAVESRDALLAGDLAAFGQAMINNLEAQKRLHDDLVATDAQRIFRVAEEHGALGWKVNGAGGEGGSVTILAGPIAETNRRMVSSIEAISPRYKSIPISLSPAGARVWRRNL